MKKARSLTPYSACRKLASKTPGWKKYDASRSMNASRQAAPQIANAAALRVGATYNMNPNASGTTTIRENCDPTASASDNPSNTILRQFHSTTSRGAYSVWATAIAVNTAPKAPQAAPISGSTSHMLALRKIAGEKQ